MVSNKDVTIFLLINQKVKLNEISGKILFFKNSMEEKDNQIYYNLLLHSYSVSYRGSPSDHKSIHDKDTGWFFIHIYNIFARNN